VSGGLAGLLAFCGASTLEMCQRRGTGGPTCDTYSLCGLERPRGMRMRCVGVKAMPEAGTENRYVM
jgi:hypothetical protein